MHTPQFQDSPSRFAHNLSIAAQSLKDSQSLVTTCLNLFEITVDETTILRLRPNTPHSIKLASRLVTDGLQYAAEIASHSADISDDANAHDQAENRSARAINVATLVMAGVKAHLALAYVEYWQGARALDNFEILAYQAKAYSSMTLTCNWDIFAPPVLLRPNEPLIEESESGLHHLICYSNAAYSYALCLHNQMVAMPRIYGIVPFEPVAEAKPLADEATSTSHGKGLPDMTWVDRLDHLSQEKLAENHREDTIDNMRFRSCYGYSREVSIYPKQRLIGFQRSRGGQGHKKGNRAERQS